MKKIISFLFILSFLYSNICFSQSGWFWQHPYPQGDDLKCIKFVDTSVGYSVGNRGAIVKTTNGGINWVKLPVNYLGNLSSIFPININLVLVCGEGGTIMRSSNGGANWQFINSGVNRNLNRIYFSDLNTGYCIGSYSTILKTTDGGNNWTSLYYGNSELTAIFFWDNLNGIVGGGDYLLKTSNAGLSWSQLSANGNNVFDIYFINNNTGFASGFYWVPPSYQTGRGCIIETTNGGNSWFRIYVGIHQFREIQFNNIGTGFASNYDKVFKTTNYGINWDSTLLRIGDSYLNYVNNNSVFVAGYGGCIIKTTNLGQNWSYLTSPFSMGLLTSLFFISESTGFAVGLLDSTIWTTTDTGHNWIPVIGPDISYKAIVFCTPSIGYLVSGFNVFKTSNGGLNWGSVLTYSANPFLSVYFRNQYTGFVGTYNYSNMYKTTNGGINWELKFTGVGGDIYSIQFVDDNTGYALSSLYGPLRTTNSGSNWFYTSTPPNVYNMRKIQFRNSSTGYLLANSSASGYQNVIYKTTNSGINWFTSLSVSTLYVVLFDFNFSSSGIGYAVGSSGKIFKTNNWGSAWYEENSITNKELHGVIAINDSIAFAVGQYGAIIGTTDGGGLPIGIISEKQENPQSFSLSQNYPNPFNPVTKIKYDIPPSKGARGMMTRLIIYDILGREIEILVNESQKPGSYEVRWDGSRYASGVYFYRLITDEFVETKKMVLIK